jgi:hypothetical protein
VVKKLSYFSFITSIWLLGSIAYSQSSPPVNVTVDIVNPISFKANSHTGIFPIVELLNDLTITTTLIFPPESVDDLEADLQSRALLIVQMLRLGQPIL